MTEEDTQLASAKVKWIFDLIKNTPIDKRVEMKWSDLTQLRLDIMKGDETWENAVRLVLINFLQKNIPDEEPVLPQPVIDFMKPILIA